MIDADLLRSHYERLLQSIGPYISKQTGMIHATSSWHPHAAESYLPVAENFALALLWCHSRSTEAVLQARRLLGKLLRWQRELFPCYLHEIEEQTCPHASERIRLVILALLNWHTLAIGDLAEPLQRVSQELSQLLPTTCAPPIRALVASYFTSDLEAIFQRHIEGRYLNDSLIERLRLGITPWGEPCWLEKPWGQIGHNQSLLEIVQELEMGKLPSYYGLSSLWSVLLHEKGHQSSVFTAQPVDYYCVSRNFEQSTVRRAQSHACCLYLQTKDRKLRLTLYCDKAQVRILPPLVESQLRIHVSYTAPVDVEDKGSQHPLLTLITEDDTGWMHKNLNKGLCSWTSIHCKQLEQDGVMHLLSRWMLRLEAKEAAGYFHQQPVRLDSEKLEILPSRRSIVYFPLHTSKKIDFTLLLQPD